MQRRAARARRRLVRTRLDTEGIAYTVDDDVTIACKVLEGVVCAS
jgi:hypothetical protein